MRSRTGVGIGGIAILGAAAVVWWDRVQIELHCQGHEPSVCTLTEGNAAPRQFSLDGVAVDHWLDQDGVDQYQVVLLTSAGRVELAARSGGQPAETTRQQVASYLANPGQGELRLAFDNAVAVYCIAALLAALALWAVLRWR